MRWLLGFALGTLAGFLLGSLVGPSALLGLLGRAEREGLQPGAGRQRRGGGHLTGLPHDEQLARAARERLVEQGLANPRVDVTIVDGVAYLRGRPRDAGQAAAIVAVVQATPGLTGVVNELKLPDAAASEAPKP